VCQKYEYATGAACWRLVSCSCSLQLLQLGRLWSGCRVSSPASLAERSSGCAAVRTVAALCDSLGYVFYSRLTFPRCGQDILYDMSDNASCKVRRGRRLRRDQNAHLDLEEISDHSDSESDAGSELSELSETSESAERPQKRVCRKDSSTDDNSDERHVDNQADGGCDERHSDQSENQSNESGSQHSPERNENIIGEDDNGYPRYFEVDAGGNNNNQPANDGEEDQHCEHVDSPAGPSEASDQASVDGSLNSDESAAETSDSDHGDSGESEDSDGAGSDSENEDEAEALNNRPIYPGAQINFKESLLAILTFILTHKLTGLCVSDLLSLIMLHCGADNICLSTLHRFRNYFKMIGKNLITCHYFCSECELPLANRGTICATCENSKNTAYFIEFPIVTQLQSMYKRAGFYDSLMFRFHRRKKDDSNVEDIYDGLIYKDLIRTGFLSNRNNISFFMYFDGIALFKSSTFSIWPVYLTINELKYKLRIRKENTVLAGLWFGKLKPNPNLFLEPLQEKLSALENDGVDLELPNREKVRVKGKLLGAVGDMPAKAAFMRFRQYNGAYSCFHCMEKGGRFDLGRVTIQVFPYNRNFRLRTKEETIQFGELAVAARQADPDASVYGVKGPTLLSIMLPNIILAVGQDIMHGVFLGLMKTLATLWTDTHYSGQDYSISEFVNVVDQRLKSIKPPFAFQRFPRSLAKEIAMYKASDWKAFFFYYSLPVLIGILPQPYWFHHLKLVTAISILCQESISVNDINSAEEMLHSYVAEFQGLYGIRHLSLTVHQLLHLPLVVKNLGPAWVYSCFFYESLNGELRQLVHGSRHVALQICSSSSVFMNLTVMVNSLPNGRVKQFCSKLQQKGGLRVKITENIDNETAVVGKLVTYVNVPDMYVRCLTDTFNVDGGQWEYFLRLKIKGNVFTSEAYN
ncbi:Halomucin, partial [Frankliniella fusca]